MRVVRGSPECPLPFLGFAVYLNKIPYQFVYCQRPEEFAAGRGNSEHGVALINKERWSSAEYARRRELGERPEFFRSGRSLRSGAEEEFRFSLSGSGRVDGASEDQCDASTLREEGGGPPRGTGGPSPRVAVLGKIRSRPSFGE